MEVSDHKAAAAGRDCPLCGDHVRALIRDHPRVGVHGACTRCVDQIDAASLGVDGELPPGLAGEISRDPLVYPTPLRLNADSGVTGRGVTICLIDSGFHAHPDLVEPLNRILASVDIAGGGERSEDNWHGTMTSVVCAGNGFLSHGIYRGIASDASVVLLKVRDASGISGASIAAALRWAVEHRAEYNIRIINLSVTDDNPAPFRESEVARGAEEAVAAGIVVVAAVGNDPANPVRPPASAPCVIAVGGVDDHNTLGMRFETAYHSTFGVTPDEFRKPEIIAPSIWLAAPILPSTADHREAQGLFRVAAAEDARLKGVLVKEVGVAGLDRSLLDEPSPEAIRQRVRKRLSDRKYIAPDYMHADGTSFAAPIVCSIIAQMIEVNPGLSPEAVRNILLGTARRLPHVPVERQGFGVVDARSAVDAARRERHVRRIDYPSTPVVNPQEGRILFFYHNDTAHNVALAGSFTGWQASVRFSRNGNGIWRAEVPLLPPGVYHYKFVVDHRTWVDDPENLYRVPDGFNGFNSRFQIN